MKTYVMHVFKIMPAMAVVIPYSKYKRWTLDSVLDQELDYELECKPQLLGIIMQYAICLTTNWFLALQ